MKFRDAVVLAGTVLALALIFSTAQAGKKSNRRASATPSLALEKQVPRPFADPVTVDPNFRETTVGVSPATKGSLREIHSAFALQIAKKGGVSLQQVKNFSWCDTPDLTVIGWFGTVENVVPAVDSHTRVSVSFSPHLRSRFGGVPFTRDRFIEIYDVIGDGVVLVDTIKPIDARPGIAFTD